MVASESSIWIWAAEAGLGFVGFGACLLFVREAQKGGTLPGCGPASDCEAVAGSRWARVGPIPIATLGLMLYGLLTLVAMARFLHAVEGLVHAIQITAVTAVGGAAVWFTCLQLLVIRRVCKYCMIFHGIGTALCIVVWLENRTPAGVEAAVGTACVLALIVFQILVPSKTYAVIPMANMSSENPRTAPGATLGACGTPLDGALELLGGRLRVTLGDWPLLGVPHAKHKVALMFDITCGDCRVLYQLLQQAVAQRPGEVAVVLIPVPLDPRCNPAIAQVPTEKDACEHARLFLAVWRSAADAFADYGNWLMGATRCPSFQEAKSRAHRRLGTELSLALTAGALDLHIQKAVDLYRQSTAQKLPHLLLPDRLVVGRMSSVKEFFEVVGSAT